MNVYIAIGCCFIPFLLVFILFACFVPGCKVRYCLAATAVGLLSVIPIAFIQFFVLKLPFFTSRTLLTVLLSALVFNGLIEETVKMILMMLLPHKKLKFGAFFACTLLCGLVLGCFEAVIYLINGSRAIGLRLITAVVVHTVCAGLSGLFLLSCRRRKASAMPFIWAVILHGIYNFFAGFSNGYRWLSLVVIGLALIECRQWYKSLDNSAHSLDTQANTR